MCTGQCPAPARTQCAPGTPHIPVSPGRPGTLLASFRVNVEELFWLGCHMEPGVRDWLFPMKLTLEQLLFIKCSFLHGFQVTAFIALIILQQNEYILELLESLMFFVPLCATKGGSG